MTLKTRLNRTRIAPIVVVLAWLPGADPLSAERAFEITFPRTVADRPLSGRVYVFLSKSLEGEPRRGPNWFHPEPFFGIDVESLAPGEPVTFDDEADGFPSVLGDLESGTYRAQAFFDQDFDHQDHNRGVGNLFSEARNVELGDDTVAFELDQVIEAPPFEETAWRQEVVLKSEMLTAFHGKPVFHRAGVILPQSYLDNPERRFPVIYLIGGFGSSHRSALRVLNAPTAQEGEEDFIEVHLDPDCKWGHHVFADSATNGPRGEALVHELIPYLDATFRTIAEPRARFVTGHSSGGWSSLWLQVEYPEVFGGVWSTSPDPVDFRDFQQVDLYRMPPASVYFDEQGNPRPIARRGDTPVLWYREFGKMDDVIKRGGQLRSFEAVFSPLAEDGSPRMLWDRRTGIIDPDVAHNWKQYDIRLKLEREWSALRDQLAGRLHVYTGELDTFYLEGAVELLKESLEELGSDAVVEIFPEKNHSNLRTAEFERRIRREMSELYRLRNHSVAAAGQ